MKKIIYYDKEIFFDDEEYEKYKNKKIFINIISGKKTVFIKNTEGGIKTLSRLILNLEDINLFAGFKDKNSLNLTKENMYIIHRSDLYRFRKSLAKKYKGTCLRKNTKKYYCIIHFAGSRKTIGLYDTEIQAAKKYDLVCDYLKLVGYRNFKKTENKEKLNIEEIKRLEKIKALQL